MKFLVVFAAVVAVACAGVAVSDDSAAPVLRSDFDISPEGNYRYAYETGNGIVAEASGALKNVNSEYPSVEVKGSYKFTSSDGQVVETTYVADENGYRPEGSHLPVGPAIPEAIVRSLAYIDAHPPTPVKVPPPVFG